MKKYFKILVFVASCLGFLLSGCEKDFYENQIKDPEQGKINFVNIKDVPFLIPTVQDFNPAYRYLTNPNENVAYRGIADLNLDLTRILEYVETNELKSYSIIIKNEFEENEDKYFENLHIIKINNQFKPFIVKYNAIDDSKDFNMENFTGKIQISAINSNTTADINYENGLARYGMTLFDECVGMGFIDLDCILSGMSALGLESFPISFGNCNCNSNTSNNNTSSNTSNTTSTTTTSSTSTTTTNPFVSNSNGGSSGPSSPNTTQPITVVPNVPPPPKVDTTDPSFVNSKLKCVHQKMNRGFLGSSESFFYTKIVQQISTSNFNVKFKTALLVATQAGQTPPDALTFGSNDGNYTIIFNTLYSEYGSNLQKEITLVHELIHVLMFNDLKNWGLVTFDAEGYPNFDPLINCIGINSLGEDFPDLPLKERYRRLICVYMQAASLPSSTIDFDHWTHSLFNTAYFDTYTFRQKIENFVLAKHDFDGEPETVRTTLITKFGLDNWKQKTSEYISWQGLQLTPEFIQWLILNNISQNDWQNTIEPFVGLLPTAKKDCN